MVSPFWRHNKLAALKWLPIHSEVTVAPIKLEVNCMLLSVQEKTYHPAVEEQRRVIARHGREISFEALNDMPVLHRNIQEAIRLQPPLILLLRQVHTDFTVTTSKGKTYRIPKVRLRSLVKASDVLHVSCARSSGLHGQLAT